MRSWKLCLLSAIAVLSVLSIAACTSSAAAQKADGEWCYLPHQGELKIIKSFNHGSITMGTYDGDWSGRIRGSSDDLGAALRRSSGRKHYIGVVTFTSAEIDGKSGALEMYVTGGKPDFNTEWEGEWVITDAGGDLENVQGHGTWWGTGWQGNWDECGTVSYAVDELDFGSE
jgi:hypothetical protein